MQDNLVAEKDAVAELVLEWAPYAVKPGVTEADVLSASEALQTGFLEQQAGYVRRELLKGHDGQWVDAIYWRSLAEAQRAAALVMDSPVCLQYFELMVAPDHDDPSGGISHFTQVRTYP